MYETNKCATRKTVLGALVLFAAVAGLGNVPAAASPDSSELRLTAGNFRTFAIGGPHVGLPGELSSTVVNPAALDTVGIHLSASAGLTGNIVDVLSKIASAAENPETLEELAGRYPFNGIGQAGFKNFGLSAVLDGAAHVTYSSGSTETYEYGAKYVVAGQVGAALPLINAPLGLGSLSVGASAKMLRGTDQSTTVSIDTGTLENNQKTDTELQGTGMSFGVGALLRATDWVSVGAAVNNIGYKIDWSGTRTVSEAADGSFDPGAGSYDWGPGTEGPDPSYTETRSPYWQIGASVQPPLLGLVAAADLYQDGTLSYGLEKSFFFGLLSVRAGQIQPGDDSGAITSGGLGLNLGPASVGVAARTSDAAGLELLGGATFKF